MDELAQHFEVCREHKGLSLFDFLDAVAGPLDRKRMLAATRQGQVRLNGQPVSASTTLRLGDLVELLLDAEELTRPAAPTLAMLYEAPHVVVANKPSGMAFGEGRRGGSGSAVELLRARFAGLRPVHPLDKETSGVVVAALGKAQEADLDAAFDACSARVEYLTIVRSALMEDEGRVEVALGKRHRGANRLEPDPEHGAPASTCWKVEERLRGFAILRVWPEGRGRSHQVRAHLAALGWPALCDALYGEEDRLLLSTLKADYVAKRGRPERPLLAHPALHAERFVHGPLVVAAPLPEDWSVLLAQLRRLRPGA